MPRNRWLLAVACLRIACVCQGVVGGDPDSGAAVQVDAGGTVTTADASTATDAGQDAGPAVTGTDAGRTIPVGMPSPGCADAGDPTLTADERLLLNLPEDSWFEVPSSHLYETCKNASTFGDGVYLVQGCAGLI